MIKESRNESFRLEFQRLKLSSGLMSPLFQWVTKHIQRELKEIRQEACWLAAGVEVRYGKVAAHNSPSSI